MGRNLLTHTIAVTLVGAAHLHVAALHEHQLQWDLIDVEDTISGALGLRRQRDRTGHRRDEKTEEHHIPGYF